MNVKQMTDEELSRAYRNALKCGSVDAAWLKDEIDMREKETA